MSKKYSTSQVVRLLELHPDWVFEAPETSKYYRQRASANSEWFSFEQFKHGGWHPASQPDARDDWARTNPPSKPKRERVKLGQISGVGAMGLCGMLGGPIGAINSNEHYVLYVVKK